MITFTADHRTAEHVGGVPVPVGCGLLAQQLLPDVGHGLQEPPLLCHLLLQLLADEHSTMIKLGQKNKIKHFTSI